MLADIVRKEMDIGEERIEMLTMQEVELLASLLVRAGINPIEAHFANSILERLRVAAREQQAKAVPPEPEPPKEPQP